MNPRELKQRVIEELWRIFKSRGYGAITSTQRRMRVGPSYFKDWRKDGSAIDLRRLAAALETLGVEAADFFRSALGDRESAPDELPGHPPAGALLYDDRVAGRIQGGGVTQCLDQLDRLRLEDPEAALARAEAALALADDSQLADLLGLYSLILRRLGKLDEAQHSVHRAIAHARRLGDRLAEARQIRRQAFIVADRYLPREAISWTSRALAIFLADSNFEAAGRCFVDLGSWYYRLENYRKSAQSLDAARALLSDQDHDYQFSVELGLAFCHLALGEVEEALRRARAAGEYQEHAPVALAVSQLRLEARILVGLRRHSEAAEVFETALQTYVELRDPLQAAFTAVELVRALTEAGREPEAKVRAMQMARFLQPLRANPIVQGALTDLLRRSLAPDPISLRFLDQVCARLEKVVPSPAGG